jgi:hypothetical protein
MTMARTMASKGPSAQALKAPAVQRASSKRDKTVNGFQRRKCICENPLCREIWKFFCEPPDENTTEPRDRKRAGHVRLPLFYFESEDKLDKPYKNFKRLVYFHHIFPRGSKPSASERAESRSGSKNTWEYLAFHHFDPTYLKEDGSGLACETVDVSAIESLKLSDFDKIKIEGHELFGKYVLAPTYDFTNIQRDYELAGGTLSTQNENVNPNSVSSTAKGSRKVVTKPRSDPKQRATTALANEMREHPDHWAQEYQKLEDMLVTANLIIKKLKKEEVELLAKMETLKASIEESRRIENELRRQNEAGITRTNLISDGWHRRNPEAAKHFFGGPFTTWDQFKCAVTKGWFPKMEVDGGTGPFTEFEKVMMTCMRANRA